MSANGIALMPHYPDTGCAAGGPSCLACRLPVCIEDMQSTGPEAVVREQRNANLRQLRDQGLMPSEIAKQMGMPLRTVHRVLAS